jgi:hypothetical protein
LAQDFQRQLDEMAKDRRTVRRSERRSGSMTEDESAGNETAGTEIEPDTETSGADYAKATSETEGAAADMAKQPTAKKRTKKASGAKAAKKATLKTAKAPKAPKAAKAPKAEKKKPSHDGAGSRTVTAPANLPAAGSLKVVGVEPYGSRYVRVNFEDEKSVMFLPVNLSPSDTIAMRDKMVKFLSDRLS